jgi:hypothetical protein
MKGLQSILHIGSKVSLLRRIRYQNNSYSNTPTYILFTQHHGTIVCCLRSVVPFFLGKVDHEIKHVPENTST